MKKVPFFVLILFLFAACGGSETETTEAEGTTGSEETTAEAPKSMVGDVSQYDPHRGEGKFTSVDVGDKLDAAMATEGDKVQGVKCASCHKLTDEKLVGPGWKGITSRKKPEWIMNFITNPDAMIDKDPELQAQLEICLVRMPNQNLTDNEARSIYEFMRKNDGVK